MDFPDPIDQQVALLKSDLIPIMESHPFPWSVEPHDGSHRLMASDGHCIYADLPKFLADKLIEFAQKLHHELNQFYDFDPETLL